MSAGVGVTGALLLASLASLGLPASVDAQQARHQIAWSGIWPGDAHVLLGADWAMTLGGADCVPGGPPCEVPSWALLAGVYGGAVTERAPLSLYVHAGLERKLTADLSLGVLGFVLANPLQGGPALRLDAVDVGALKVGYGWGEDGGVLVSVEIASALLTDVALD